jgi:hypothetical protein
MRTAASGLCQSIRAKQCSVEALTLFLRTRILPIWAEGMAERPSPLALCTTLQLFYQCLACVQVGKQ